MTSGENGATALFMMLGYFNKYVPMDQLRETCVSSRNGTSPAQLKEAATHYFSVNADDSTNPDGTNFLNDGAKGAGAMAVGRGAFGYGDHSVAVGYGATAGAA